MSFSFGKLRQRGTNLDAKKLNGPSYGIKAGVISITTTILVITARLALETKAEMIGVMHSLLPYTVDDAHDLQSLSRHICAAKLCYKMLT